MPTSISDEQFDALFGPGSTETTPQQEAMVGTAPSQVSDASFETMFGPEAGQQSQKPGNVFDQAKAWVDYYGGKFQAGEASVARGRVGMMVMNGQRDYESVKADANLEALQARLQEFEGQEFGKWTVDLFGNDFDLDVRKWAGTAAESLPFMRDVGLSGAAGAAGGAAVGAGGAVVVGQLGPQVGLPEELITVPLAATRGAQWGFRAGSFKASADLMTGMTYLDFLDEGIEPETAKTFAQASGVISGLIEVAQLGQLSAVGRKAFVQQVSSKGGQATLRAFVSGYFKDVGVQVAEEELQAITELTAQSMAAMVDNNPNAAPTMQEIKDTLTQTLIQATQASTALVGGAKVAGAAPGATVKGISQAIKTKEEIQSAVETSQSVQRGAELLKGVGERVAQGKATIAQALEILKESFEAPPPTQEQIDAAADADVNATLDQILEPIFEEDGSLTEAARQGEQVVQQVLGEDGVLRGGVQATAEAATSNTVRQDAPAGVQPEFPTDPVVAEPLAGAPSIEVQGRMNFVRDAMKQVDADIAGLEAEFTQREDTNTQIEELRGRLEEFSNRQKQYSAQLKQLRRALADQQKAGKDTTNLEKTIDQVSTRAEANQNQLTQTKEQLSGLKTSPVKGIVNKLERLYDKRAAMDEDLVLLQNGLFESEDLKGLDVKLKANKIISLRAKAANEVLKNFRRGVREGVKFTKDDIKGVQTQLVSLVRDSGLSLNDQGKFIRQLKNIQTPSQLQKALPAIQERIDSLLEKQAVRDAQKRLKRVLSRADLQKAGKRPVSKYTPEIQKVLTAYREMVLDPKKREAALQRGMAEMERAIEESQSLEDAKASRVSQQDLLESLVAQRVGNLEEKSAADINSLSDEIDKIIETGKAKKIEQKLAEAEARQQRVLDALASINGVRPVDTTEIANSELALNTKSQQLKRLLRTLGRSVSSWDGLMTILSQHDQKNALRDLADVWDAVRVEYANQKEYREKAIDSVIKAVGTNRNEVLDRIVSGSKKETVGKYVNADGQHVPLVLSRNEAIKLYNQMQDPDLIAGLKEGNKYTFNEDVSPTQKSTEGLLDDYLTEKDKAMARGLLKFYDQYYERVNSEWEDETGASLTKNNNYSGYARRSGSRDNATQEFFHEQFSRSTIKPASTQFRTANAQALELSDAFVDVLKHVQDFEHWIAWRKPDKDVRAIFTNRQVRNAIKLKYGDGMMRTVDDRYHDMIGTRVEQQQQALKFLDVIRRNAGTAFVGGKGLQFFKQYTAVANFMLFVDGKEFVSGMTDFVLNPKKAIETLEKSPILQQRVETFDRDLMEAMQRDDVKAFKKRPTLLDVNMWFVKWGDRATLWSGGWAVYQSVLKKTGDPDKAMKAFEKAFNSTQSSGTIDQLSELERSGPGGKMMTLFLKQPLQMFEFNLNAVRKAMALPNVENTKKAFRTLAVTHAAQTLFQAVASAPAFLFGSEDEQKEEALKVLRAAILGPMTGLPLIGDIIGAAATQISNWVFDEKEYVWKPKFLPYDAAGRSLELMKDSYEFFLEDADSETFFDMLHDYSRSVDLLLPAQLGGGIPKEPYIKLIEPLFVEDEDSTVTIGE